MVSTALSSGAKIGHGDEEKFIVQYGQFVPWHLRCERLLRIALAKPSENKKEEVNTMYTIHGYVSGRVQGVGFRYFVRKNASAWRVNGWAKNLADGRVEFLLQGDKSAVTAVCAELRKGPALASVSEMTVEEKPEFALLEGFTIS